MVIKITTDETLHFQTIVEGLREEHPEATEEQIQKMATLESDVLYCYQQFSFEKNEYKYKSIAWVRTQLIEYGRIDSSVTGADIQRAIDGNMTRKRIYSCYFDNSMYNTPDITKYKYNVEYVQRVKKPNPFESAEYKKRIGMC